MSKILSISCLICIYCFILNANGQNSVNIVNSSIRDSKFLSVNTCDASSSDNKPIGFLETALQSWKAEQLESFCALQCKKDICSCQNKGFLKVDENTAKEKRQTNEVNIKSSLITQSTFIDVKLCGNDQYSDLVQGLTLFLAREKLRDYGNLCKQQCCRNDLCKCKNFYPVC